MEKELKNSYRWRVVIPSLFILYLFAYIDRTNISFAMTELENVFTITSTVSGFISGVFFIGYILLMAPVGHLASFKSARTIILILGILTGIFSSLQGMVTNIEMLVLVRFLLGLVEGGIYPAMGVLIANWFPLKERGRATSIFYMYVTVAPLIMSPVSGYIITNITWLGLDSWRWLFITQGIPVLLFAIVFYILVPNHPVNASSKRVSQLERDFLVKEQEIEANLPKVIQEKSYLKAIKNRNFIVVTIAYFFAGGIGNYGISIWLPTILKAFSSYNYTVVGIISAIPWLIGTIGMVSIGVINDKLGNKKLLLFILNIIAGLSLFLAIIVLNSNLWLAIAFISLTIVTGMSSSAVFLSFLSEILPANMLGGMTGLWNALGNIGGFVGPFAVGALMSIGNSLLGVGFLSISYIVGALFILIINSTKTETLNISDQQKAMS